MPDSEHDDAQADLLVYAREAVRRSERFTGTGSELNNIREALRLLIQYVESDTDHAR